MNTLRRILCLGFLAVVALGAGQISSARSEWGPVSAALAVAPGAAARGDESFCGIREECHVDSRVNATIHVYINGVYRGTMGPWGDIYPIVRDLSYETTELYAVSSCGRYTWRRTVYGDFRDYHWILNP
jgi:hypothetical protein